MKKKHFLQTNGHHDCRLKFEIVGSAHRGYYESFEINAGKINDRFSVLRGRLQNVNKSVAKLTATKTIRSQKY